MSFRLLPWEHLGAPAIPLFSESPTLKIGGKKRQFELKFHKGRVWFREGEREKAPIYATLDTTSAPTENEQFAFWERQIAEGNYAALSTKRAYFPQTTVRGGFIFLVRSDGSALVQEHFDQDWFELPRAALKPNLWNSGLVSDTIEYLLPLAQNQLLARTISASVRAEDAPRLQGARSDQFLATYRAAIICFISEKAVLSFHEPIFKSHSVFQEGSFESYGFAPINPVFQRAFELLTRGLVWVGVDWEESPLYAWNQKRIERFHKAGIDQFGADWRGNWAPKRARLEISLDWPPSAHERIEAPHLLREFLEAKTDAKEIEDLMKNAL